MTLIKKEGDLEAGENFKWIDYSYVLEGIYYKQQACLFDKNYFKKFFKAGFLKVVRPQKKA